MARADHVHPQRLIADSRYGTVEIIRMLEENGIRAYVPLHDWEHKTAYFGPSKFTFDTTRDIYVCPQGESLQRSLVEAKAEQIEYRADPACCNVCPLKEQCTPSDRGRSVHRSFYANYLDRVRAYHQTAAYRKAMQKRGVWIESLFAEAKQWHGLTQFRLRGVAKVNGEGLLVATGQNLKRWLVARGWGRQTGPAGSRWGPIRRPHRLPSTLATHPCATR